MRRNTERREAILKILIDTRGHPTADDIYDEVRKEIPNISKGTVYRKKEAATILEVVNVKKMPIPVEQSSNGANEISYILQKGGG